MAEKENKQKHKSTIDKYFGRTAKAYKTWVDENDEERNYLQIASESTGDTDKYGNQGFDFHIAYSGRANVLASGLVHSMQRDEFVRQLIIGAAKMYYTANIKIKDTEADNQIQKQRGVVAEPLEGNRRIRGRHSTGTEPMGNTIPAVETQEGYRPTKG